MQLRNSFQIARDVEEVFATFLDIERVAQCMPGATLTKLVDDENFEGEVKIKVGPLAVAYAGSAQLQDVDRDAKTMQLRAKGRERSGAGNADALVKARLSAVDGGTRVDIDTDLSIRGKVAQFGRGAIGEVSGGLMQQFADNVEAMLAANPAAQTSSVVAAGSAPRKETGPVASATAPSDDNALNAMTLLRPMLTRALVVALPVIGAAVAAFIGARLGSRRR